MSNPPNDYNTNTSFNKFKGTYYNSDIDVSGGNIISRTGNLYLAPNSSIFTSDNQILFNDEFQFTDFVNNVNVLGQLKNIYNSIEYDVGLQCEKVNTLVSDVATLSPIVSDTQFKTTGFYWDAGLSTTVFNNNASFPNASISSTAINNTSFVSKSGAETIDGIKTFNLAPVMSGASITNGSIPSTKITGTACNLNSIQTITGTKTFSVVQNFTSNLRLDGSLLVGTAGGTTITNAQLQLIPNISTLNTKTTNMSFASNITTISNTTNLTDINFTGNINTFTKAQFDNAINFSKSATSDLQTQINNFTGVALSASNVFTGATNQFQNTIRLDGSLVVNANGTTLSNSTLNKIQYLSNITSDIKASLDTLTDLTSGFYRSSITGTYFFTANLNTEGKFNTLTPYEIGNLTGTTEPLQIAIDALKTKTDTTNINLATTTTNANDALQRTTEISFSDTPTPQTNITNKLVTEELVFTTDLNDITPTTFGYLSGVSSNIQTQLNSKTDSIAGSIIQHISSNLQTNFPTRFLLCNGQSVSRTTYANLFLYIGTTYGSVDGNSFNVPDFQACFLRMASSARTVNGVVYTPNAVGTIQQDSLEAHVHSSNLSGNYLRSGSTNNTSDAYLLGTTRPNRSDFPSFTGGVSSSHRTSTETRPLNHSVYFYITC
jgi:microcystin-dependent protein